MITLQIPYNLTLKLLRGSPIYTYQFDILSKEWKEYTHFHDFIKDEVYEWLIETIGYEQSCFRQLDRTFTEKVELPKFDASIDNYQEWWNTINPVVPAELRTWAYSAKSLSFVNDAHASLFKLRWF